MTIRELKKMYSGEYEELELYVFLDKSHRLHSDFIVPLEESVVSDSIDAYEYHLMDEHDYNLSILANTGVTADFREWYGNSDAKVLVIVLSEDYDENKEPLEPVTDAKLTLLQNKKSESAHDRFDRENTKRFSIKLNKNTDADILTWLDAQPSKQGAIKAALRHMIESEVE